MAATATPDPCIVPRCEKQPTRLYPGGRFCEDHKPQPKGRPA